MDIGALENQFRSNVIEQANVLKQLLELCVAPTRETEEVAFLAMKALSRCFREAMGESALYRIGSGAVEKDMRKYALLLPEKQQEASLTMMKWILSHVLLFKDRLVGLIGHDEGGLAIPAMNALGELMTLQFESLAYHELTCPFPGDWIEEAAAALVANSRGEARQVPEEVLSAFLVTFGAYGDCRIHIWTALRVVMEGLQKGSDADRSVMAVSVYNLLRNMEPPKRKCELFFGGEMESSMYKVSKKAFSKLWGSLLVCPMTEGLYKNILSVLHTDVLPHLSHPIMMVDFCFAAYRKGGYCSLLSLKSLFVISTTINIEVPEFYPKLYALLQPSMFLAKHRGELFKLTDIFLSSEYLPLSVAASFLKKLARLALTAPPQGALICLQLIFNIIRRHPNTMHLLHRESSSTGTERRRWSRAVAVDRRNLKRDREEEEEEEEKDDYVPDPKQHMMKDEVEPEPPAPLIVPEPEEKGAKPALRQLESVGAKLASDSFNNEELNPELTGAVDSSLWELLALQQHYWPEVADMAASFSGNLERALYEMERVSDLSVKTVVEKLRRKKVKSVPLELRAKSSLLPDETAKVWFG